jgi:hypothetical protein
MLISADEIPVLGGCEADRPTDIAVYQAGVNLLWWVVGQPTYKMWGMTNDIPLTRRL